MTRGGAGRKQGRKPLVEGEESTLITGRVSQAQRARFRELGGSVWLRRQIDLSDDLLGEIDELLAALDRDAPRTLQELGAIGRVTGILHQLRGADPCKS